VLGPRVIYATRLVGVPRARQTVCPTGYAPSILRASPTSLCLITVLIARGRDAADVAISNTFGPNTLTSFKVWAEECA